MSSSRASLLLSLLIGWGVLAPVQVGLGVTIPKDQDMIIVAADKVDVMVGPKIVGSIPSRTVLPVLAERAPYLKVKYNEIEGWVLAKGCFRLGKNPPSAEGFCRKGLDALTLGDLEAGRMEFFKATCLDPNDQFYKGYLESLTTFAEEIRGAVELDEATRKARFDSRQKMEEAAMLNRPGLGASGEAMTQSRKITAQERANEGAYLKQVSEQNAQQLVSVIEHLEKLIALKVDSLCQLHFYHLALGIADYKKSLLNKPEYAFWTGSGKFTMYVNAESMRSVVVDSDVAYRHGADALVAGEFRKAREFFDQALKIWPNNRLAKDGTMELGSTVDTLSTKQSQAEALFKDGKLLELEALGKDVAGGDVGHLQSLLAEGRATLEASRKAVALGQAALKEERWADAFLFGQQALEKWPQNPEAAALVAQVVAHDAILSGELGGYTQLYLSQSYIDAIAILKKLQPTLPKDVLLVSLQEELQSKQKLREADLVEGMKLQAAFRLQDAYDLFKRRNYTQELRSVAVELAKLAEKESKWERAVAYFEEAGKTDEAKRVRQAHHVLGAVSTLANEKTGPEVFAENSNRVCVILIQNATSGKSGTGFLVSKLGHIVTNQHVADEKSQNIKVRFPDEKSWRSATLVKCTKIPALALLKIEPIGLNREPARVARYVSAKVGSRVYALGFPGIDLAKESDVIAHSSFTDGIISNLEREIEQSTCIQSTATINHGNSGGPLFDGYGRVIGVNTMVEIADKQVPDVNFAIKIEEVWKNLLEGIPVSPASD